MDNINILVDDQISRSSWNNFVEGNPFRNSFQTPFFLDLINSVKGFEAKVIGITENGKLSALCVITYQKESGVGGYFSKRAIIYGGPILTENKTTAAVLLVEIATQFKKAIYIETRNLNDYSYYKKEFEGIGWNYQPHMNFHLDCSNEEIVWKNLNSNRQRQIKKALKTGVIIEVAKTKNEVNDFYTILKDLYQTKIKKPIFPLAFFENLINSEVGKILLVKYENRVIGGIACPFLKNDTIYELYICGLDQEYKDCSPSVMATYAAIEYGYKNNLSRFDFMGAGKPEQDYGVRDFKGKFGGDLVEHGRFIKINNKLLFNFGKLGLMILSKPKKKN